MTSLAFTGEEAAGTWIGRVWAPEIGPCVVTHRDGVLVDITSEAAPTVRDVLEKEDPVAYIRFAPGKEVPPASTLLAPADLQAVKAAGVTFARSMIERVIEERAGGDPAAAEDIRARVKAPIGDNLADLVPGSAAAQNVKDVLIAEGLWSQYLEVGIGPFAEVFTKCPPLAAVGHGADVGLHPASSWNNPEPEVVLAVTSKGRVVGATLGNDVNLRDIEGRSALLLPKAKDNNASASIGPMIRLFDDGFNMDAVKSAALTMTVTGEDGYTLKGASNMAEISRDPLDIVAQTIGAHHQYPDGFMLYLGTAFAPIEDRDRPGEGFTHKIGDCVTISASGLSQLTNTVRLSTECPPWNFGMADLMRNLAGRGLLGAS